MLPERNGLNGPSGLSGNPTRGRAPGEIPSSPPQIQQDENPPLNLLYPRGIIVSSGAVSGDSESEDYFQKEILISYTKLVAPAMFFLILSCVFCSCVQTYRFYNDDYLVLPREAEKLALILQIIPETQLHEPLAKLGRLHKAGNIFSVERSLTAHYQDLLNQCEARVKRESKDETVCIDRGISGYYLGICVGCDNKNVDSVPDLSGRCTKIGDSSPCGAHVERRDDGAEDIVVKINGCRLWPFIGLAIVFVAIFLSVVFPKYHPKYKVFSLVIICFTPVTIMSRFTRRFIIFGYLAPNPRYSYFAAPPILLGVRLLFSGFVLPERQLCFCCSLIINFMWSSGIFETLIYGYDGVPGNLVSTLSTMESIELAYWSIMVPLSVFYSHLMPVMVHNDMNLRNEYRHRLAAEASMRLISTSYGGAIAFPDPLGKCKWISPLAYEALFGIESTKPANRYNDNVQTGASDSRRSPRSSVREELDSAECLISSTWVLGDYFLIDLLHPLDRPVFIDGIKRIVSAKTVDRQSGPERCGSTTETERDTIQGNGECGRLLLRLLPCPLQDGQTEGSSVEWRSTGGALCDPASEQEISMWNEHEEQFVYAEMVGSVFQHHKREFLHVVTFRDVTQRIRHLMTLESLLTAFSDSLNVTAWGFHTSSKLRRMKSNCNSTNLSSEMPDSYSEQAPEVAQADDAEAKMLSSPKQNDSCDNRTAFGCHCLHMSYKPSRGAHVHEHVSGLRYMITAKVYERLTGRRPSWDSCLTKKPKRTDTIPEDQVHNSDASECIKSLEQVGFIKHFSEPGRNQLVQAMEQLHLHGKPFCVEIPYERADGDIRYFKVAGKTACNLANFCWGMIQDVTGERAIAQKRELEFARLEKLVGAQFDGWGVADLHDTGCVTYSSTSLNLMFQRPLEGTPVDTFFSRQLLSRILAEGIIRDSVVMLPFALGAAYPTSIHNLKLNRPDPLTHPPSLEQSNPAGATDVDPNKTVLLLTAMSDSDDPELMIFGLRYGKSDTRTGPNKAEDGTCSPRGYCVRALRHSTSSSSSGPARLQQDTSRESHESSIGGRRRFLKQREAVTMNIMGSILPSGSVATTSSSVVDDVLAGRAGLETETNPPVVTGCQNVRSPVVNDYADGFQEAERARPVYALDTLHGRQVNLNKPAAFNSTHAANGDIDPFLSGPVSSVRTSVNVDIPIKNASVSAAHVFAQSVKDTCLLPLGMSCPSTASASCSTAICQFGANPSVTRRFSRLLALNSNSLKLLDTPDDSTLKESSGRASGPPTTPRCSATSPRSQGSSALQAIIETEE